MADPQPNSTDKQAADKKASDNKASDERYEAMLREAEQIHGVSLWEDAWKRLNRNTVAMVSLWFLGILTLLAFFTPLLPFQGPIAIDTSRAFSPPTLAAAKVDVEHLESEYGDQGWLNWALIQGRVAIFGSWAIPSICGTDELGRDLLSRLFWGARVSLAVGVVATFVSLVIGVSYGAISGYIGGWVDDLLMRIVDVLYSIPFMFIVIFLITVLGEEKTKAALESYGINRITIFFIVVGAVSWLTMARVVRGQVISLKNEQFVEAARVSGASWSRIVFLHLVPNLLSVVIVYLTLTIPRVMLFEAFLSFLGLGVQAPEVSWGQLANTGFRVITPITISWWLVVFPGLLLGLTLFALNFLGDGLRDALDPRMKNRD